MLFLSHLTNIFMSNIGTTLITLFICYISYELLRFYLKVLALPRGPFPLPLLGNLLAFRVRYHWSDVIKSFVKKYGSVFTLWIGSHPIVVVSDIEIARDVFNRSEYLGRYPSYLGSFFSNDKYQDMGFTSYGPTWTTLRKVAHSALKKYSKNDKLGYLVCDYVDKTLDLIKSKEGVNKEFCPKKYLHYLFINISSKSYFGIEYSIEDKEFGKLIRIIDVLKEQGKRIIFWEFSSLMRRLDWSMVKKFNNLWEEAVVMVNEQFKSHYENYDESIERDFSDALISAKNIALKDGKNEAAHLSDANLAITTLDAFFGGTDTTINTFDWILLLLGYYPEVQKKLRQEIENQIGDRIPTHEDRNHCNYVMSFISESLRFRNIAPAGIPHSTMNSTELNGHLIPAGTTVIVNQGSILTDERYWPNGDQFIPERFLRNGKHMMSRPNAYIPFGIGRRGCPGEKVGLAELFFVLVRFVQMTEEYDIVLGDGYGLEPDPNVLHFYFCKNYKIILKSKQI